MAVSAQKQSPNWLDPDFVAAGGMRSYGPSGISWHSPDATHVENIPDDPETGAPMVVRWVLTERLATAHREGYRVVPEQCFHPSFNGDRPMRCASPTARIRDGRMTKSGGIETLCWTTPTIAAKNTEIENAARNARRFGPRDQRTGTAPVRDDAGRPMQGVTIFTKNTSTLVGKRGVLTEADFPPVEDDSDQMSALDL